MRASIMSLDAIRLGGGKYRRLAGNDLVCRETSESPCCCATSVTIIELRMKVPLHIQSPTTYTARPRQRNARDASPSARPISHAYLAKRALSRVDSFGL